MKPVLEHLPLASEESFVVRQFEYGFYPTPWHFHPEYEIVLVTESSGKRFIGDNIADFGPGDLAFLGPNLPHLYRNDTPYYEGHPALKARSIVVHFSDRSFGDGFLALPESVTLRQLFEKSARGLQVNGRTKERVITLLHELCELRELSRWLKLLEILNVLSASNDLEYISHEGLQGHNEVESDRLNRIFEFVMNNFREAITLAEAAAIVNLSENSFSRYFSQRTRKSFTGFVNEVRLNHACKLLIENRMSITDICFECGFNNLSNFHRRFKNMYKVSPLLYRRTVLG